MPYTVTHYVTGGAGVDVPAASDVVTQCVSGNLAGPSVQAERMLCYNMFLETRSRAIVCYNMFLETVSI